MNTTTATETATETGTGTSTITLAQLLMTIDNYKTKMRELAEFLVTNARQRLTEAEIPTQVQVSKIEFDEQLELYHKLSTVLPQLQGIMNMENNRTLTSAMVLSAVKAIESDISLYHQLKSTSNKKNSEIVEVKNFNPHTKMYDSIKKVDEFTCYVSRRDTNQTLNQLEKKKKQLQLDIHAFNHTHSFIISNELINIY